ncbi:uncharacterized protein L3040_008525 [Drepanopeziza brunnea f. sp. 'multigermtubi']|uniref:UbiD family decarboxylase n=1 Tax=Marssonina brunnea f. sp. multigermtubi (strain MB_m1) TaxID=1072389 RepID=K1XUL0_MARBU|nr:ubiD family decarboxylase [Drepanopeziza brunnea f. sp. 'multigermtubi' MB_m1]EKD16424.1 ubiD family decarboxylase [Drepanopeziza brunnea f. sp. 'multigermtubi' MB_m1]KAJ5033408.1 hypothetical protein L3040_008525 [Drepanopeziza brunnea f. sp. 'multigermtubi']
MEQAATANSAVILTALSLLVILFRLFLRRLRHEKLLWDDWIMLGGMGVYVALTATYPVVAWNGINVAQTKPEDLKEDAVARIELASKLVIVQRVLFMTYLWCLKACILIYYTRLAIRTNEMLSVRILAAILAVTWIVCLLAFFIGCRPISDYWRVLPSAPDCAKAVDETVLLRALDAFTNIFLMAIPLKLIIQSDMSRKMQLQLLAVYIGSLLLIAISTLGIIVALDNLGSVNMFIWAQVQCFIATLVANAPPIHDLWRHGWSHIRQRKFNRDSCVPEYSLNILAPTEHSTRHHTEQTDPRPISRLDTRRSRRQSRSSIASIASRGSRADVEPEDEQAAETTPIRGNRLAIRNSIRKVNDRLRRSLEQLEIERKVVVVQQSLIGEMTPSPADERHEDFFSGFRDGKRKARIRTEVSCGSDGKPSPEGPKGPAGYVMAKFKGEEARG